jgi:hypothetical protein
MKIGSFAESNNNQTELVRAQQAALIASGFRYSLSLNKAHSKHRALLANRLHFGVVDKSDDYLPSAKAYLRTPAAIAGKMPFNVLCCFTKGASRL